MFSTNFYRNAALASIAMAGLCMLPGHSVAADIAKANVCTAGVDGKYQEIGTRLKDNLRGRVDLNLITTAGSEENLRKLSDGSCDIAFVQNDAQLAFAKTNPTASLNVETITPIVTEYAHMVCNRDANIDAIKDLYGTKNTVIIGKPGSGSAITWYGFGTAEKRYQPIPTSDVDGTTALNRLITNKAQCMLFVAGLKSGTMSKVNELGKGKLKLIKLNDGDLDSAKDANKQPIYRYTTIPGGTYGNLQDGTFSTSVKTLSLDAILTARTDWTEKNADAYTAFSTAAIRLHQQLQP